MDVLSFLPLFVPLLNIGLLSYLLFFFSSLWRSESSLANHNVTSTSLPAFHNNVPIPLPKPHLTPGIPMMTLDSSGLSTTTSSLPSAAMSVPSPLVSCATLLGKILWRSFFLLLLLAYWCTVILDQKVRGSIPDSNPLCICHSGGWNSYIQALEVYFHCFPPRLSDETLNRGPESIA